LLHIVLANLDSMVKDAMKLLFATLQLAELTEFATTKDDANALLDFLVMLALPPTPTAVNSIYTFVHPAELL